MKTEDIIKKIMGDITPTEYPNLYSACDVEEAIRKALEMQSGRVKKLRSKLATPDGNMSTTTGMIGVKSLKWDNYNMF